MSFSFGIYPGGAVGGDRGIVEPVLADDPALISRALDELHGSRPGFLVRAYLPFRPPAGSGERLVPAEPERLLGTGTGTGTTRRLELVLGFRDPAGDVESWLAFVREAIDTYAERIALLQICEEPTVDAPFLDGATPNVLSALVRGVVAARDHVRDLGLADLAVGFNATPTLGPDLSFWHDLAAAAAKEAPEFHEALGYVGFDFFPDVFRPIPEPDLARAVELVLTDLRERVLPTAGIGPEVPVRIAENGWSTGAGRTEQRQAEVLETVLSTILGLRERLNITGYSHFCLRDADSGEGSERASNSLYYGFGLLRADYTPKPAFAVYRALMSR
ncbi:hypothetical protein Caci_1663 [Catenulispora acidiphila DSM 44928]|uniref:Uncharacterized protein n=1 Tax=Catenulispora acidiphila (strain DSM 44928 / JCM 14897 / NBRC 102108 / NRRL B-24433 / ID139908) TaxID=479433 RepID=C7QBK7_CATAD|nr:hypothetical protein [Catenulispora acidiphila]ACU70584.1 hypothetical protein Caci_1663 [Catenulispora acidiphila DSM 44928]